MAEYTGAVKQLFKSTPNIENMPTDEPNTYAVTLYDLKTYEPVDIVIDERLCTKPDSSQLFGCAPSVTGDLWACYIEKAVAIHCGGWDKISGGNCLHAWRLLTGCQDQYVFKQEVEGKGFTCGGAFNPQTKKFEELGNSPHDGYQGCWPMAWPEVGGALKRGAKCDEDEMFERMCAWDDANFLMAAGSKGEEDSHKTDGIADCHAYSILAVVNNAAGTKFDLIKLRNPWGTGEIEGGKWGDDGPYWNKYPKVKEELEPALDMDDGVFWMEKDEFFTYFHTVFLCAKDMSEFIEIEETPRQ